MEVEYRQREAKKTKEIQSRSMDRENKTLNEMSDIQFAEKKEIFETYLPDALMRDIYEELGKREKEDMELYKAELEQKKAEKMAEMEAEESALQSELDAVKVNVDNLSQQELKLKAKMDQEERRRKKFAREKELVVSS